MIGCPRCAKQVRLVRPGLIDCADHGEVAPLISPDEVNYQALNDIVWLVPERALYLPWPMSSGWTIARLGCVPGRRAATVSVTVGSTVADGPVEVTVVSEDPGVGLGARCAGLAGVDPGRGITANLGGERPAAHVRIESRAVPLWIIPSLDANELPLATTSFAGEADGRWLWVIVRPASAALLLRDDWLLVNIAGISSDALGMPFGGSWSGW